VERRRSIAERYDTAFKGNEFFKTIPRSSYGLSSYHLYPILINSEYRDRKREIFSKLRLEGLGVQVHYIPVYLQPYYQNLGYRRGSCPVAEDFYQCEISIPMYPALSDSDVDYVISKVFKVFHNL
jgi:dTDP-4-amino-4,6-dideoxygalactose transaminase